MPSVYAAPTFRGLADVDWDSFEENSYPRLVNDELVGEPINLDFPVDSFNGRTGDVILLEADLLTALGYTPVNKAGDTMTGSLTVELAGVGGVIVKSPTFSFLGLQDELANDLLSLAAGPAFPGQALITAGSGMDLVFGNSGTPGRVVSMIPLVFTADNTQDIGENGAFRPRTGYFGTSIVVGDGSAALPSIRGSDPVFGAYFEPSANAIRFAKNSDPFVEIGYSYGVQFKNAWGLAWTTGAITAPVAGSLIATNGTLDLAGMPFKVTAAPVATGNYGLLNLGNGGFAGGAGHFPGNSLGTGLAMNFASGYAGFLMTCAVGGDPKVSFQGNGNLNFHKNGASIIGDGYLTVVARSSTQVAQFDTHGGIGNELNTRTKFTHTGSLVDDVTKDALRIQPSGAFSTHYRGLAVYPSSVATVPDIFTDVSAGACRLNFKTSVANQYVQIAGTKITFTNSLAHIDFAGGPGGFLQIWGGNYAPIYVGLGTTPRTHFSTYVDLDNTVKICGLQVDGTMAHAGAGTGGWTALYLNITETGAGTGRKKFESFLRGGAEKFFVDYDGRLFPSVPNSAPVDAHLNNGSFTAYLDEAANKLMFRVKYSDGTLKTGEIALV